jgi:Glycosyl hydrolase family 48/Calx-beta domain
MRQARFRVTLSKPSSSPASVNYATIDGSAKAPSDYTAVNGTLYFAAGETTKDILVMVRDMVINSEDEAFTVALSLPQGVTLAASPVGTATIPGDPDALPAYVNRFHTIYNAVKLQSNGYFGPLTGPNAYSVPYHCPEHLICEAPDWGHQTVSETASFWVGMEAMKGLLDSDWTGFNKAWSVIESVYVPSASNAPLSTYTPTAPADYTPEGDTPNAYPVLGDPAAAKGVDGLYQELLSAYGTMGIYLMHWIIDVDGRYGFHNGDTSTINVFLNTYQRGLQESAWETIPQPEWEDFTFGNQYGYLPLFSQGLPTYPAAANAYGAQWRYTSAPDAESRAIQWSFWANKWAVAGGASASVTTSINRAKKMGDYLRYCLMDKYFRQIGPNRALGSTVGNPYSACHYLISWYVSWGGMVPDQGNTYWSFRIGSSECHFGYQSPDAAYYMATNGGGMAPLSPSAGDVWQGSMYRQLEMIRWLQTTKGLIAGGVSNSWHGRYGTPNDGRDAFTFYGMYYTYAPVWHDPPSNNWFGFQAWGLARVADLFLEVADKNGTMQVNVRNNCEVILDRFVNWILANVTSDPVTKDFVLPDTLNWTSSIPVAGKTTTAPNLEGFYEYIPSQAWDGTGDKAAFWSGSSVPNPNLDFTVVATGKDIGVASSLSVLLIHYAQAKRILGKFNTTLPFSSYVPQDAYQLARDLLDGVWLLYRDAKGIVRPEQRADYLRYSNPVYVPSIYSGHMPNGDAIGAASTFISLRSWQKTDPDWPKIQAYLDNPIQANIPVFTYHRFWAQAEYSIACGAMHHYFGDLIPE